MLLMKPRRRPAGVFAATPLSHASVHTHPDCQLYHHDVRSAPLVRRFPSRMDLDLETYLARGRPALGNLDGRQCVTPPSVTIRNTVLRILQVIIAPSL